MEHTIYFKNGVLEAQKLTTTSLFKYNNLTLPILFLLYISLRKKSNHDAIRFIRAEIDFDVRLSTVEIGFSTS